MNAGSRSKLTMRCPVARSVHKAVRAIAEIKKPSIPDIIDDTFSVLSLAMAQRSRVRQSPELRALLDELSTSTDWYRTLGQVDKASPGRGDFVCLTGC
jgi:hypothetical protein